MVGGGYVFFLQISQPHREWCPGPRAAPVTLHVDEGNGPAEALYRGAQYGWVRCPQVFWGVRRRLLVKRVTPVVWAVDAPRPVSGACCVWALPLAGVQRCRFFRSSLQTGKGHPL